MSTTRRPRGHVERLDAKDRRALLAEVGKTRTTPFSVSGRVAQPAMRPGLAPRLRPFGAGAWSRARHDAVTPSVPRELRWLLGDLDADGVDVEEASTSALGRVLEHGRLSYVQLLLELYGPERIHAFFRAGDHPVVSERTRSFWHESLGGDETWLTRPDFRKHSGTPGIG